MSEYHHLVSVGRCLDRLPEYKVARIPYYCSVGHGYEPRLP